MESSKKSFGRHFKKIRRIIFFMYVYIYIYTYICAHIFVGGWGCESNREIGFVSFSFVRACVRARRGEAAWAREAMLVLPLGCASRFCPPAPPLLLRVPRPRPASRVPRPASRVPRPASASRVPRVRVPRPESASRRVPRVRVPRPAISNEISMRFQNDFEMISNAISMRFLSDFRAISM